MRHGCSRAMSDKYVNLASLNDFVQRGEWGYFIHLRKKGEGVLGFYSPRLNNPNSLSLSGEMLETGLLPLAVITKEGLCWLAGL